MNEIKKKEQDKFVKETSELMERFNMETTGSVTLDERVRQYRKEQEHAQDS